MRPAARTRGSSSLGNGTGIQAEDTRICVVMVGLPARGKSLIAQKGRWHAASLAHESIPSDADTRSKSFDISLGLASRQSASM